VFYEKAVGQPLSAGKAILHFVIAILIAGFLFANASGGN
jgi:hypothetical protein